MLPRRPSAVGGNGFIAAFVGGLAFGSGTRGAEHEAVRFTELQGSLLAIGVWIAFGLTLAGHVLTDSSTRPSSSTRP